MHHHPVVHQVSGLLLSTPVEAVPIMVTYTAVRGGVSFHVPPSSSRHAAVTPAGGAGGYNHHQHGTRDSPKGDSFLFSANNNKNNVAGRNEHETAGGSFNRARPKAAAAAFPPTAKMGSTDRLEQIRQEISLSAKVAEAMAAVDASAAQARAAKAAEEKLEAVIRLENAFPGKPAVSPVSLRSTATWQGRVEGMDSSGALVRATLTRRDLPGVAKEATEEGGGDAGIVEVRRGKSRRRAGIRLFCRFKESTLRRE